MCRSGPEDPQAVHRRHQPKPGLDGQELFAVAVV
jgi:hypothetical protein